jgi:hypothetical protein
MIKVTHENPHSAELFAFGLRITTLPAFAGEAVRWIPLLVCNLPPDFLGYALGFVVAVLW